MALTMSGHLYFMDIKSAAVVKSSVFHTYLDGRKDMGPDKKKVQDSLGISPEDYMGRFVDLFRSQEMLNQSFKIGRCNREYRIFCDENRFFAYRLNPHTGISPGIPGWITCMVTQEEVIDGQSMYDLDENEPSVKEWLKCIAAGDYEHIKE